MTDIDEAKMEQAMLAMAGEMEGMNEEDPQTMARFMRRFSDMTGMRLGDGVEEALNRLEAGEDPDQIESEMGDIFESDDLFAPKTLKGLKKRYLPPERDDTLYKL